MMVLIVFFSSCTLTTQYNPFFFYQAHSGDVGSQCNTIQHRLSDMNLEGITASSKQWTVALNDQVSVLEASLTSQQAALSSAQTAVERFVTEELMDDLPTGTTPQRRGYSYPHILTHTKPHSELLEKYREGLDVQTYSSEESPVSYASDSLL